MRRRLVVMTFILAASVARHAGQGVSQSAGAKPDISGFWELSFDGRKVPTASLLPAVTRAKIEAHTKADVKAIRWCNLLGMPFTMDNGRPLDIRQGSTAVIIVPENASAPRYLYLNRATHISAGHLRPVDTAATQSRGGKARRSLSTRSGSTRTAASRPFLAAGTGPDTSHLVERYRLLKDGSVLSVTFTWTDPKVFRTPHTYEFRYNRLPANYEPRQWAPCDPFDAAARGVPRRRTVETSITATSAGSRPRKRVTTHATDHIRLLTTIDGVGRMAGSESSTIARTQSAD